MLSGVMWGPVLLWFVLGLVGFRLLDIHSFNGFVGFTLAALSVARITDLFIRNWQDRGP